MVERLQKIPKWNASGSGARSPWRKTEPAHLSRRDSLAPCEEDKWMTYWHYCLYDTAVLKPTPGTEFPGQKTTVISALEKLARRMLSSWQEAASLAGLQREIASLQGRITFLENAKPIVVPIQTLAPEQYEVIKQFQIVLEFRDPEYVATFFDAEIAASGATEVEAIVNLKDLVIATFEMLAGHPQDKLGPSPRRQLQVLKEFIRKAQ